MSEQIDKTILINTFSNNESINTGISSLITLQCRIWFNNNDHINLAALLDTGSTKRSESPHRTAAFIVRNHSDIKRGKARIYNLYNAKPP